MTTVVGRRSDGSKIIDPSFGVHIHKDLNNRSVNKMYRYQLDGTVVPCDDTPDYSWNGNKYMRSTMREGQWVFLDIQAGRRMYIDESEVPKPVLMAELCGV